MMGRVTNFLNALSISQCDEITEKITKFYQYHLTITMLVYLAYDDIPKNFITLTLWHIYVFVTIMCQSG